MRSILRESSAGRRWFEINDLNELRKLLDGLELALSILLEVSTARMMYSTICSIPLEGFCLFSVFIYALKATEFD